MSATVLQSQLVELLKQARKTRPTLKTAGLGGSKSEKAQYALLYGSVTLRALPGEGRVVLMQQALNDEGKPYAAESFIQANVVAPFVVSIELDTLYEWVKLAPAHERLELAITHTQFNVGRKQFNSPTLTIKARGCSANFKADEKVLGENPISLLTASDTWELWASAPETPVCGDAPCPVISRLHFHRLMEVIEIYAALHMAETVFVTRERMRVETRDLVGFFSLGETTMVAGNWLREQGWQYENLGFGMSHYTKPEPIRSANLDGEMIILSYIIPANTALGTDRWIAHSGKGETHLKLELYKEQVGAIKLVGYDGAWFNQNKPFRCHIYVILDKQRKIKEVLPPETTDPEWTIMDGSPAPEKIKKRGVAGRKVDQTNTQAAMARVTLCMKLGLPLDATDEEMNAMQETPEYAPAGYVKTVHPSELQPGDVLLSGCGATKGDVFLGLIGKSDLPQHPNSIWWNALIRSPRGNVFPDTLLSEHNQSRVVIYRDPVGYALTELEERILQQWTLPETPHPTMGWVEDGKGGVESKWVSG